MQNERDGSKMSLEELGPELWVAEGGVVSFFGFDYPTRMAVVRLDGAVTTIMEKGQFDRARFTTEVRRAMSGRQTAH